MSKTSDFVRFEFKKNDDIRDAGLVTPAGVVRVDDVVYGADRKWQVLDLYRPREAQDECLPVIVSVHGGGWVYGDKERYQFYCMSLAERGFAVVNFTYRLAPEFLYPAGIEDTNLVFAWVMEHAEEYHLDTDRIFGVGDSAGAHMLGIYANICTNPEYASGYDFSVPEGLALRGIALNCGVYRVIMAGIKGNQEGVPEASREEKQEKNQEKNQETDQTTNQTTDQETDQTTLLMADLLPEKGSEAELQKIDVISHVTEKFPPVFLMTATGDFLQDQAPLMAETLMRCKIPFEYHFYGDSKHELGHVFHCNMKMAEASVCNDEECDFFHKLCKNV